MVMTTAREEAMNADYRADQCCEERDKIWDLADDLARQLKAAVRTHPDEWWALASRAALEAWRKESGR